MNLPLGQGLQSLPKLFWRELITHGAKLELPLEPLPCCLRGEVLLGPPASPDHLCFTPASSLDTGQHWAARHGGQDGMGQPAWLTAVLFFLLSLFFPSLGPLSPGSSSHFNVRFVEAELSEPFKREMSSGRRNAESSFHQPGPRRRLRGMSGQL